MNKNEKFVITINRELGSGGRTVGRLLAEKLGVPFYDKAVIKTLQEKYHISPEEIERLKGRKHSWWADVERILKIESGMSMDYYMPKKGDAPDLVTTDEMFKTETLILQDLAAGESCVVAGRSGFHVFRLHPNHLSVLIQAITVRITHSEQSLVTALDFMVEKMTATPLNDAHRSELSGQCRQVIEEETKRGFRVKLII